MSLRIIRVVLAFVAAMLAAAGAARAQSLTVVELFTSHGCGACFKADHVLADLTGRDDILAITWPVSWDYLGPEDGAAIEASVKRQKSYNRRLDVTGVYSPQMIIDGRSHAVGTRAALVAAKIGEAESLRRGTASVMLTRNGDRIAVSITGEPAARPASVLLVWFDSEWWPSAPQREDTAPAPYFNLVRGSQELGQWTGGAAEFSAPFDWVTADSCDQVAVILQEAGTGPVIAAYKLKVGKLPGN